MKNLKLIYLLVCFFTLASFKSKASEDLTGKNLINFTNLEFTSNGDLQTVDFVDATCYEIRDGVRFSITVGCFLCSEERAVARCERVLSRRLDRLDPWNQN